MDDKTKERARALFEQGLSISAVARQLEISFYDAKNLKPEAPAVAEAVEESAAEEGLVWPIALEIPAGDLDALMGKLPAIEVHAAVMTLDGPDKADIFRIVLQARLDRLAHEPLAMPEMQPAAQLEQQVVAS